MGTVTIEVGSGWPGKILVWTQNLIGEGVERTDDTFEVSK